MTGPDEVVMEVYAASSKNSSRNHFSLYFILIRF